MNTKEQIRLKLKLKSMLTIARNHYSQLDQSKQKIVVALAADYGNLGDVAITYAQTEYLRKEFPEAEIIDFPISNTFSKIKSLKKVIGNNDIFTIVGGGNTGDMYDDIEYCRQFIIQQFPNNKIISFPQTIDFSDTNYGNKAFKKAVSVYDKHEYLTLSARESKSKELYENNFKNNVVFAPDIVLSLNKIEPKLSREGITFCMRDDQEKVLSEEQQNLLITKVSKLGDIKYHGTHIDKNKMSVEERTIELEKIWDSFKKSRLVITDRLHGMIFCAITETPCIAIDNSNNKITGVHDAWLNDYNFIRVYKDFVLEDIINDIHEIIDEKAVRHDLDFSSLRNAIHS